MQIRPIRTERDHERAVARISELMRAQPGTLEGDELDVLATLVDAYEAKHHAIDAPDPITAIQFRMEQQGLARRDLEPMIGTRARVSEILTGKRGLTLDMVRRVKSGLGISADLLIGAPAKAHRLSPAAPASRGRRVSSAASARKASAAKQARKRA